MNVAVVVPTIRPDLMRQWERAWRRELNHNNANLYVVHDNQETWDEIDNTLGERGRVISRQSDGVRCWGFLKALRDGADIIISLDDDVEPTTGCIYRHIEALTKDHEETAWTQVVPFRTRGIPFRNTSRKVRSVLNHGLWRGVPDLDAPTQLLHPDLKVEGDNNRVLPRGLYFPMCAMNVAFMRFMAPAMYFPPMGTYSPYNRFGDIWAGIIAKRVADHIGLRMTSGFSVVHHTRASDPFKNLVQEAAGVGLNETLWAEVDKAWITERTVDGAVRDIARHLTTVESEYDYLKTLGGNMVKWCELVEEARCESSSKAG